MAVAVLGTPGAAAVAVAAMLESLAPAGWLALLCVGCFCCGAAFALWRPAGDWAAAAGVGLGAALATEGVGATEGAGAAGAGDGVAAFMVLLVLAVLVGSWSGAAEGFGASLSLPSAVTAAVEPRSSDRNEPPPSAVEDAAPDPASSALMVLLLWAVLVSDSTVMSHQKPF